MNTTTVNRLIKLQGERDMKLNITSRFLFLFFLSFSMLANHVSFAAPQDPNSEVSYVNVILKLDPNAAFRGDTFYEVVDVCADRGLPVEVEGPCNTIYGTCSVDFENPLLKAAEVINFHPFKPDLQFQVTLEPTGDGNNDVPGLIDEVRFYVKCLDVFSDNIDGVVATKVAESAHKKVFVTSETYTGDLGGIEGADAKCNALAEEAGLYGTYKAWISETNNDRLGSWTYSTLPYVRVDGVKVADGYRDLTDCTNPICLRATINVDEKGNSPALPLYAWTFTRQFGHAAYSGRLWRQGYSNSCSNWRSSELTWRGRPQQGMLGSLTHRDESWTFNPANRQPCNLQAHLYCFQQ